jgi:hypothetical protein
MEGILGISPTVDIEFGGFGVPGSPIVEPDALPKLKSPDEAIRRLAGMARVDHPAGVAGTTAGFASMRKDIACVRRI